MVLELSTKIDSKRVEISTQFMIKPTFPDPSLTESHINILDSS